jgi:Glycosyl hydrolases family 16
MRSVTARRFTSVATVLVSAVAGAACGGTSANATGGPGGDIDASGGSTTDSRTGPGGHDGGGRHDARAGTGTGAMRDGAAARAEAGGGFHDGGPGAGNSDSGVSQEAGSVADSGGAPGTPVPPPQVPSGWNLALDDEFNGSTLGPNWSVGTNLTSFVDNGTTYWNPYQQQEAEYLTSSMVAVQDSNLILSTEASSPVSGPYGSKSFVAGYVTSYGKFAFQYGYIEFRMEMPPVAAASQTGLWPALWLLNSTYANSDEIDVLESYGADQTAIQMTAQPSNSVDATITAGYHILAVLHETSTIAFYVDNQLVKSFNQSMSSEMAILMGLQLGSSAFGWLPGPMPANWPGGVNGPMTADFKVDWVHVWTPP